MCKSEERPLFTALGAAAYVVLDRRHITGRYADAALENGRFDLAETLLRLGGHPVQVQRFLEKAVELNAAEAANRYLDAGADPDTISSGGKPMVYLAARGIPALKTDGEENALNRAARNGDVAAFKARLRAGDNPYLRDGYDLNALETAIWSKSPSCVEALLEAGVDPNIPFGRPLKAAVKQNDPALVDRLLEKGARPDAREKPAYKTALHEAVCRSLPIDRTLVDHGADVNAHGHFGRTALHRAVLRGSADAVAVLLEHGADIHAGDKQGISPLDSASSYRSGQGNSRVYVQMMAAAGTPVQTGFDCAQAATSVEELICADLDLAQMDAKARTALKVLDGPVRRAAAEQLEQRRQACVFSPYHYPEDDAFREAMKCLKTVYKEQLQTVKASAESSS